MRLNKENAVGVALIAVLVGFTVADLAPMVPWWFWLVWIPLGAVFVFSLEWLGSTMARMNEKQRRK